MPFRESKVSDLVLEPKAVLTRAAEAMRELGWHRLLAKRGYARDTRRYQQSLLDHSLVALDLLLALGDLLGSPDAMSLSLDELAQACLGIVAHDAGKASPDWQAWVRRGDDTPSPQHDDEAGIREQLARFAGRLGFKVNADAVTAALRTLRSKRTAAATARQVFFVDHQSDRWIAVADLVAAVDHACSASSLLDALDTLRRGYLGDKLRFDYHLVRVRGFSTPFVHRAVEEAFQAAGWTIALRFVEGSLYARARGAFLVGPTSEALKGELGRALEQALAGGRQVAHAELVVNPKAATEAVFPSADLVDINRLREYLEVGRRRAGTEGFTRKQPEHQRKVVEKFFTLVGRDSRELADASVVAREVGRISRAHPEMMVLKVFRDATLVKAKEGKVFNPERDCFDDGAEPYLESFARRLAGLYDQVFGEGAYEELAGSSTLDAARDMRTVVRFWSLAASRFARTVPGDRVELLPDKDRSDLLIEQLCEIFSRALDDLPLEHRPRSLTRGAFAEAFTRDLVHPTGETCTPEEARQQLYHYCSGKESTKTPKGRHICPICNGPFGVGRPAKADFLDKPEQHTNRAPALGSGAPIVICATCRLDRVFGKLVAGLRPTLTFVLYPRHNVGREVGRRFVERARDFMRQASAFMADSTPDAARKPSLGLTQVIAQNLGLRSPDLMPASELADAFLFRNNEAKLREYRKNLEVLLHERAGETIEDWNATFDTSYPDAGALVAAIERAEIADETARELRAEAFAIRPFFAMVAETPHAILLPSADRLQGKEESEVNGGIRQVFVALVLALGLDVKVAILRDGVPAEPELLEGVVAVPGNAPLRALFRGAWIDLVDTDKGPTRRPGARTWLRAIAAASQLAGLRAEGSEVFPPRDALHTVLSATTPGHIVRRIESVTKQPIRKTHMEWIKEVAQVLPGYDAAVYDAACGKE